MIINFKYYFNDLKYGSDIVLSLLYFADPLGQTTIDSRLRYDTYSPHHHLRGSEKQNGSPSGRSPNGETYKHLDSHRYELPFITICKVIIIFLFLFSILNWHGSVINSEDATVEFLFSEISKNLTTHNFKGSILFKLQS